MTEPERFTDEDLDDAVGEVVESADEATLKNIREKVTDWVYDLLTNHPEKVPPTFAIKLFLDLMKAEAQKNLEPDDPGTEVSILDRLDALPPEHAAEILRREIDLLDAKRAGFFAALEQLMEAE